MEIDKSKICFVSAKAKNDEYFDGVAKMGYHILIPYKDWNIVMRCLREAWFRLKLPKRSIWYNSKISKIDADMFIVKDPLIVPEFLVWMKRNHPQSRIILNYNNRAAMSINPDKISNKVAEKWSYDKDDCEKYDMNLKHGSYMDIYRIKKLGRPVIDVLYLGRDKGRANMLFDLKSQLEHMGLKTYFHICADRKFLRYKKPYYKPLLPYKDYLRLMRKSKAILNIVQPGQTSITMREYEAVFNNVKCITNNPAIKEFELYHPSRYFILGIDDMKQIHEFFKTEFVPVEEEKLAEYKFDAMVVQFLNGETS